MASRYLCVFLQPEGHPAPVLGNAIRLGVKTTSKYVDAGLFLYHLLVHSPNPWKLEQEYLNELRNISASAIEIINELSGPEYPDAADWAHRLSACLLPLASGATSVLPSFTDLAQRYFNHLALALWDFPGKPTPDVSVHPDPDVGRVNTIRNLLRLAREKRKPALKLLVELRDIPMCPVTGLDFIQAENEALGTKFQMGVFPQLAHIIPFSLHNKMQALIAIEAFTGEVLKAKDIVSFINTPENAVLLQHDAHKECNELYSWGIEAVVGSDGIVHYYSRLVRPGYVGSLTKSNMDKELILGSNVLRKHPTTSTDLIALPDPRLCNFMLAIKRVLYGSGAAEVLDLIRKDDEHSKECGSGIGSSNVFDDLLGAKLNLVSMSQQVT